MVPFDDIRGEEEILRRARRGDVDAFGWLCEQHRRRIWRVAASVTRGSAADADDLAQVAIVRAYQAIRSFRGDTSFEAWLCRIALNAAHDYQKSAWRRRVLLWGQNRPDGTAAGEPSGAAAIVVGGQQRTDDEAELRETKRRVRAAVAALGTRERVPIWLIYFEEFTVAEVARLETVPESTIRSRVKAGLRRLERALCDLEFPEQELCRADGSEGIVPPKPILTTDRPRSHDLKGLNT